MVWTSCSGLSLGCWCPDLKCGWVWLHPLGSDPLRLTGTQVLLLLFLRQQLTLSSGRVAPLFCRLTSMSSWLC